MRISSVVRSLRTLCLLVGLGGLAWWLVGVPLGALGWFSHREAVGLRVGADDARDLQVAVELFLKDGNDDLVGAWRVDAFRQRAGGVAKNQGVITHAEDTGFGEHDFSDLVPAPNRRPQVRPTPANFRGWVLRLLGLRLLFLWLSLSLFLPFL